MTIWSSDNLGSLSQKICWALFGTTAITVGLRIYCRLQYSPRHGGGLFIDDLATVGCLLALLVFCVLLSVAVSFGSGQHYDTLSTSGRIDALKWNTILTAATPWICTLPKFAIIMTLSRILTYGKKTTMMLWGLAISCQVFVAILSIWDFAQCQPVAAQWDSSILAGGGHCASPSIYLALSWATYSYSTALDIFFALFPVPFVMRLKIPLKTRIGVAISLSISLVGFAISIYKFTILDRVGDYFATDPSFPMVYLCMTHAAEGSFLIMSTSLATLRPLYRGLRKHVVSRGLLDSTPLSDQSGSGSSGAGQSRTGDSAGLPRHWTMASSRAPASSICWTNFEEEDVEAQLAVAVPVVVLTPANDEERLIQPVPTSKFNKKHKHQASKECLEVNIADENAAKRRTV
ncbi:hypothetical protein BD289DRAFT_376248 [Coniella lustricola]|uniref:Rhodopsin domain-containing protein n=1 Tax=Coniella lustricola TaxID=2025994 RepID=A0A2T2ZX30_9PEZI|nr:hypothetical protein BD289DRAFT_376248 [Coniella lustricola]